MHLVRYLLVLLPLLLGLSGNTQPIIGDSTYLRIADRTKAMEAIRFDLSSYMDTLRVYRDAIHVASSGIDAGSPDGQARRSRLGTMRHDAKHLGKEMSRLLKRMKRHSPPFEECAMKCSDMVKRTKLLRTRLEAEGVRPER